MHNRRNFLKTSLIGGISMLSIPLIGKNVCNTGTSENIGDAGYGLTLDVPTRLFDGKQCWVHPRAGIVPGAGRKGMPRVVMTMNTLDLSGSDVFKGAFGLYTDDLGKLWTEPQQLKSLAPRYETIDDIHHPVASADFWPRFHQATQTLLGIGHTIVYTPEWEVKNPRPRHTSFAVYNPEKDAWSGWEKLKMPDGEQFQNAGAGCVQRYDEADGTILLPIYFTPPNKNSQVTVLRCAFDGQTLRYQEQGNELSIDNDTRGLHEPSITRFKGAYFLTIRNDERGFVSRSQDGLHFEPIKVWKFDDGTELGNYNTQQHWVTHSEGLFLVYTRRGANNDHVFRHRAPLFMAEVDPERLCVIRSTEQILVPERGARLGNFGVTEVSADETWVTVSEWMQPEGVDQYGSDGSVYIARIHWNQPNLLFK
jgi:hypothetical protein